MKINNLTDSDLDYLGDAIASVFNEELTHAQIRKLLTLHPTWDGVCDTLGRSEVLNKICMHFVGFKCPRYGDEAEFEHMFYRRIEAKKEEFIKFINS